MIEITLRPKPWPLQPRECEVLAMIGEGLSNKEIQSKTGFTEMSTRVYVTRVYRKTGLTRDQIRQGGSEMVRVIRELSVLGKQVGRRG